MTRRSDWDTPGPPFLGILSPPCRQVKCGAHFSRGPHTHRHIYHIDNIICQLPRIVRRQIVAPALDEEDLAAELCLEGFQRTHVGGDVFADGGVRTAAGLDGEDALGGEGLVVDEEFLVFAGEDVVGYGGWMYA